MTKKQILNKQTGFTLVELTIAVVILVVLAAIGLSVLNNLRATSRDAKRQEDIQAIAKALEASYTENGGTNVCPNLLTTNMPPATYCRLYDNMFQAGKVPSDPLIISLGRRYCIWSTTAASGTPPANPTTAWNNACPNITGYTVGVPGNGTPSYGITAWKVCAQLEQGNRIVCVSSRR